MAASITNKTFATAQRYIFRISFFIITPFASLVFTYNTMEKAKRLQPVKIFI